MRSVINISLPSQLTKAVENELKNKHFASKSEFFRYLLREWLAGRLAIDLEKGRKEYRTGSAKILKTMKSLW